MSCCKNELGQFPHNRDINTGVSAVQSGIHELRFTGPNYVRFSKFLTLAEFDDIVIPQGLLNEDCAYSLEIIQPDSTLLSLTDCTNFALTTFINKVDCSDVGYL